MLSVMGQLKVNLEQTVCPIQHLHNSFIGEVSPVVLQTVYNSAGADTIAHTSIQVLNMQAARRAAICAVKLQLQSLDGMCMAAQAVMHVVLM